MGLAPSGNGKTLENQRSRRCLSQFFHSLSVWSTVATRREGLDTENKADVLLMPETGNDKNIRIIHEVLRGAVVQAASLYLRNTGKLPVLQRAPVNSPGTSSHSFPSIFCRSRSPSKAALSIMTLAT
jgi:hypothetical protein